MIAKKRMISFVLLSTFRNSGFAEILGQAKRNKFRVLRLGKKKKQILLFCSRLFVTLASPNLTLHSEMKRKTSFPFAFHSFFRNSVALMPRNYSVSAKKRNKFFCFALDFS